MTACKGRGQCKCKEMSAPAASTAPAPATATYSIFAFNPKQDDDHRVRGIRPADLASVLMPLVERYQAVLVEHDAVD